MIKVFIVEDEPPASKKLELFLQKISEIMITGIFVDGRSFLTALTELQPDLVFMDIEMPGMTGIQILQSINDMKDKPQFIITSAYEKYALSSFDFDVTDYLLKPYTFERLQQAVTKAKERQRLRLMDKLPFKETSTITIRTDLRTEIIDTEQIISLESLKDYVRITTSEKRMLTLSTLSYFEDILPHSTFIRIHRSFIINLRQMKAYDKNSITMIDGNQLPIGKKYKELFDSAVKSR